MIAIAALERQERERVVASVMDDGAGKSRKPVAIVGRIRANRRGELPYEAERWMVRRDTNVEPELARRVAMHAQT